MTALENIHRLLQEYRALLPMGDDARKVLENKFRMEFNYNSNHIEGNTLTYRETELLLLFESTIGEHTIREYDEMQAHDVAFRMVKTWANDPTRELTEQDIKELNKVILVKPFWKEAITPDGQPTRRLIKVGDYKEQPNSVRLANGEIFEYTSPIDTPIEMEKMVSWYRKEQVSMDPLIIAALLHYRFVRIHPFGDGNGRISRLLMNYVLLRKGYPPVVIKSKDKSNYLLALRQADVGDLDRFVEYIALQMVWSLELAIKAAKGENIDEPDDLDKRIELAVRALNKPNVITQAKSSETSLLAVNTVFLPLVEFVEHKLEKILPLFISWERIVQFNLGGNPYEVNGRTADISGLRNWIDEQMLTRINEGLFNITYHFRLSGFKKLVNPQHVDMKFEVLFNEFDFFISTDQHNPGGYGRRFVYGHAPEEGEIESLGKVLIEKVLDEIDKGQKGAS